MRTTPVSTAIPNERHGSERSSLPLQHQPNYPPHHLPPPLPHLPQQQQQQQQPQQQPPLNPALRIALNKAVANPLFEWKRLPLAYRVDLDVCVAFVSQAPVLPPSNELERLWPFAVRYNKRLVLALCQRSDFADLYRTRHWFVPTIHTNDVDVMTAYCRHIPRALQDGTRTIMDTESVVATAVAQDGLALQYASRRLQHTPSMLRLACHTNPRALELISHDSSVRLSLLQDYHFCRHIVAFEHGALWKHIPHQFQHDWHFCVWAVSHGVPLSQVPPAVWHNVTTANTDDITDHTNTDTTSTDTTNTDATDSALEFVLAVVASAAGHSVYASLSHHWKLNVRVQYAAVTAPTATAALMDDILSSRPMDTTLSTPPTAAATAADVEDEPDTHGTTGTTGVEHGNQELNATTMAALLRHEQTVLSTSSVNENDDTWPLVTAIIQRASLATMKKCVQSFCPSLLQSSHDSDARNLSLTTRRALLLCALQRDPHLYLEWKLYNVDDMADDADLVRVALSPDTVIPMLRHQIRRLGITASRQYMNRHVNVLIRAVQQCFPRHLSLLYCMTAVSLALRPPHAARNRNAPAAAFEEDSLRRLQRFNERHRQQQQLVAIANATSNAWATNRNLQVAWLARGGRIYPDLIPVLSHDRQMALLVAQHNPIEFNQIGASLYHDDEFIQQAVALNGLVLRFCSPHHRTRMDLVVRAIATSGLEMAMENIWLSLHDIPPVAAAVAANPMPNHPNPMAGRAPRPPRHRHPMIPLQAWPPVRQRGIFVAAAHVPEQYNRLSFAIPHRMAKTVNLETVTQHVQEQWESHRVFIQFLRGFLTPPLHSIYHPRINAMIDSHPPKNLLPMLECGMETGTAIKQLIASYVGIPTGEMVAAYRTCWKYLTSAEPSSPPPPRPYIAVLDDPDVEQVMVAMFHPGQGGPDGAPQPHLPGVHLMPVQRQPLRMLLGRNRDRPPVLVPLAAAQMAPHLPYHDWHMMFGADIDDLRIDPIDVVLDNAAAPHVAVPRVQLAVNRDDDNMMDAMLDDDDESLPPLEPIVGAIVHAAAHMPPQQDPFDVAFYHANRRNMMHVMRDDDDDWQDPF